MKKLYSVKELAETLGVSRQAVEKAVEKGTIQQAEYKIGKTKGWTVRQAREIKEGKK